MNNSVESNRQSGNLSVSIVVYRPNQPLLERTLASLAVAGRSLCDARPGSHLHLYVVDNGGLPDIGASLNALEGWQLTLVSGQGNVGYGCGHNLAIERASSEYHLVLNPDIEMQADALVAALEFLDKNPTVGLLSPSVVDDDGQFQLLCRQYPTLADLFVRGFLPESARRYFAARLARYEMRGQINESDAFWDPPIVSGCFMLFRTDVLRRLGGFDERYFLYFEDYDLSLRTHEVARIVYLPTVSVQHHGGGAARKGSSHIRMFIASAFKFYNRFGWKWL